MLTETAPPPFTTAMSEDLARHMRLATGFASDEAAEIEAAWRAAVSLLEERLALCLAPRSFVWTGRLSAEGGADAPVAPLRMVSSVARLGTDGETTPVDMALVSLDRGLTRTRICAPTLGGETVEIAFEAGFGADWQATPASLRRAAFMLAAHYFDNRHAAGEGLDLAPLGVDALIRPWSQIRLSPRVM